MSELMDTAVLSMPYDMAMKDELTRKQFYHRAQLVLVELEEARAALAAIRFKEVAMTRLTADKHVNRDDLRLDLDRGHLLNEAAARADYFFRQTDGSYKFPSLGGQVSQLIEMLLAAANLPADKPAVAVPDDINAALSRLDKTHYRHWVNESPPRGGYICGDVNTMHLVKIVEFVRELASSPPHSQQSAVLVEALESLRECIMETRGPDAHSALELADAALVAYRKQGD